jgi:hypothetical protein
MGEYTWSSGHLNCYLSEMEGWKELPAFRSTRVGYKGVLNQITKNTKVKAKSFLIRVLDEEIINT